MDQRLRLKLGLLDVDVRSLMTGERKKRNCLLRSTSPRSDAASTINQRAQRRPKRCRKGCLSNQRNEPTPPNGYSLTICFKGRGRISQRIEHVLLFKGQFLLLGYLHSQDNHPHPISHAPFAVQTPVIPSSLHRHFPQHSGHISSRNP